MVLTRLHQHRALLLLVLLWRLLLLRLLLRLLWVLWRLLLLRKSHRAHSRHGHALHRRVPGAHPSHSGVHDHTRLLWAAQRRVAHLELHTLHRVGLQTIHHPRIRTTHPRIHPLYRMTWLKHGRITVLLWLTHSHLQLLVLGRVRVLLRGSTEQTHGGLAIGKGQVRLLWLCGLPWLRLLRDERCVHGVHAENILGRPNHCQGRVVRGQLGAE